MHTNYCLKNISKCPFCARPHPTKEMQQHIEEARGDTARIEKALSSTDFDALTEMIQHGLDVNKQNEFPNSEGLLHLAVR